MTAAGPDIQVDVTRASSSDRDCPGCSAEKIWDDISSLRGEILPTERLLEHAADIARAHGPPSSRIGTRPLRQRFAAAQARIREAYETLARDVKNKREPSPAEEWLLDNSHVVEEQIREIREDLPWGYLIELPRIDQGVMRGFPRVYGLCLDYLRHGDARVDLATLVPYVLAYQSVQPLKIGELWAIPIMLRLGLVLTVGGLAESEASAQDRVRTDALVDRLEQNAQDSARVAATLAELGRGTRPPSTALLVQLIRRLRALDSPLLAASEWIRAQCEKMGVTPEELVRRQHLKQAADQVSVGNAITSMSGVSALDWNKFFEQTSTVEAVLREDPMLVYDSMDDASRDRCRHAVERLARRGRVDETAVARAALELAQAARIRDPELVAYSHVGYYLVDRGRVDLERIVSYRPSIAERFSCTILAHPAIFYLGCLGMVTAILCGAVVQFLVVTNTNLWTIAIALCLFVIPATEIAAILVNSAVLCVLPPRLLQKLQFKSGVPEQHRTLVVIPVLIDGPETLASLLEELEVRSLANPDVGLHFALLSDFADGPQESMPQDEELAQQLVLGIQRLNERYPSHGEHRYLVLHRRRLENPSERCFMGWERKRGKLEELNRLLRGATDTSFGIVTAPPSLLQNIRYVITLDADTELPRDVARKLIGTLAHPLNRPCYDAKTGRVEQGHGIIQPRVGTLPVSARKSRFARAFSGPLGVDPYTTAVSDVYQDLFGEGSYVGKGIYDVDAFAAALADRTPENRMLSHDLFEGIFARAALATDIEVLDDQPDSYAVVADRLHRWIRGDWQLLPWLGWHVPGRSNTRLRSDLRAFDWWRIFDNLRRSLLASSLILLALVGWFTTRAAAQVAMIAIATALVSPLLGRIVLSLARAAVTPATSLGMLGGDVRTNFVHAASNLVFLLDRAIIASDAIGRSLYRSYVSHRGLLEWKATRQVSKQLAVRNVAVEPRIWMGAAISALTLAVIWILKPEATSYALPLTSLFCAAPIVELWFAQPIKNRVAALQPISIHDRKYLRLVARKTWRFFDTFVTEQDNWLPPDNFQEVPRRVIAHRTSPTNIGLYLASTVAAHDFGFITLRNLTVRLAQTLSTLERMEGREGHILNWYDTISLRPLDPVYVSTVDSGNLGAFLWTVSAACGQLANAPLFGPATIDAVEDVLRIAVSNLAQGGKSKSGALHQCLTRLVTRLETRPSERTYAPCSVLEYLRGLHDELKEICRGLEFERASDETRYWLNQALELLLEISSEVGSVLPSVEVPSASFKDGPVARACSEMRVRLTSAVSIAEIAQAARISLARCDELERQLSGERANQERDLQIACLRTVRAHLERSVGVCDSICGDLNLLATRAAAIADGMNFRFLFDEERCLFRIGFNVGSARMDSSHYDLLASEARLASFLAIAKGDAPTQHWFRMMRPRATVSAGRVLLSWSGSMFEYLMPLLVTESYEGTLLDETYTSMLQTQRMHADNRGVPWGISEAAYNVMDLGMTYQYRAFGVPGLGLKSGLGEDLVIAPYATALAAMVAPAASLANFRALSSEGMDGQFGYYEAIDYTPAHVPPGRHGVVVKAFMAHHQGMTLVALDNTLNGAPMRRRFQTDPRVKATALLLEERIPLRAPLIEARNTQLPSPVLAEPELDVAEHMGFNSEMGIRAHLLGQGELSTLVTASGAGYLKWRDLDVIRFREDSALQSGIFIYIRDHEGNRTWSAGYEPTRAIPDFYDAAFSIDRIEFRRRDGDIETVTEIAVSPEHPAEIRRITLSNPSESPHSIDLTTYTEVCLSPHASDVAHRAFENLFVETEAMPSRGALLAKRRPRGASEAETWVVQVLAPEQPEWSELDFDSSRPDFLGRLSSLSAPAALLTDSALSGRAGAVLDPALILRRRVHLLPGQHAKITLTTALALSREEALALVDIYTEPNNIPRTFELAWVDARVELRHLGVSATQAHRFQKLLSAITFPRTKLRANLERPALVTVGKGALWAQGISGDLPVVVLRIDNEDFSELLRELLLAHEFLRLNGVVFDLVLLNEEAVGYLQPLHDLALDVIRASPSQGKIDQRGGVFLRCAHHISDESRYLLLLLARVVLAASAGSLAQQLNRETEIARFDVSRSSRESASAVQSHIVALPELMFDNGIGGFDTASGEYVIHFSRGACTPLPWCNVIANPIFGSIVSESGSSCTWFGNSQRQRLTSWSNDPLVDPSAEIIYLRDEEDGAYCSLAPCESRGQARVVRHGQGYSCFEICFAGIECEIDIFVSHFDPVKMFRVRLRNEAGRRRQLSVYGFVEWVLGASRENTHMSVASEWDPNLRAILATNAFSEMPARQAFFLATTQVNSITGDREEFFGPNGTRKAPRGLTRKSLSGRTGMGLDPCAAIQVPVNIESGETFEFAFVLGCTDAPDQTRLLAERYQSNSIIEQSFADVKVAWNALLGAIRVETPDDAFNVLINRWLLYQVTSCRLWARSGFYQSSGAYGFRDQLQDVLALLHSRPDLVREHLLRAAARQFSEGDVQHWWHPETGEGVRTRCSDDMLWLPYATAKYVSVTGDEALLDEPVVFLEERPLNPDEDDLFSAPRASKETVPFYEHCIRALEAGATSGPHGLPKIGSGDWNDGMNRVGRGHTGESVWLACFLARTLQDFVAIAQSRSDSSRVAWCNALVQVLRGALEEHGWDGNWYRRAFYDDGTPLGSRDSPECSVDAIAQSWAAISGIADPSRVRRALAESERQLVRSREQLMLLLTPPFAGVGRDPGYIRAYPPGIRENGGQYTHGVLWTVEALCLLGEGNRAWRLFALLNPINHARVASSIERYQVEPYVMAGDVYAEPSHVGRGGWTWYTGSAGVMYRIAIEHILGVRREGHRLLIEPCIPSEWAAFQITYRCESGELRIQVENPSRVSTGVRHIELDGRMLPGSWIPLDQGQRVQQVRVTMGGVSNVVSRLPRAVG
jgi:cyclic beta-1,2-glucan synthetase